MSLRLDVHGIETIKAQLQELGDELAVKVLAQAARKAFQPVLETAQGLAPVGTGLLKENIKITVKRPKSGDAVVQVGLRIASVKGLRGRDAQGRKLTSPHWRWHFIELGTAHRAARPFLRPALEQNAEKVLGDLKTVLARSIAKAIKRKASAARKAAKDPTAAAWKRLGAKR